MNRIEKIFSWLIFVSILLLVGGCSKEEESSEGKSISASKVQGNRKATGYRSIQVKRGGSIFGKVVYNGKWTSPVVPAAKDVTVCGQNKKDPSLIVNSRGEIRFAVVRLMDLREGKSIAKLAPVLDQKRCEFHPHVLAFPVGTTVSFLNNDGILHNIHSFSEKNIAFNKAQPKYLKKFTHTFTKAEIVSVKCDVHSWMSAWLFVTDHPYYDVTSKKGLFKINMIPPGEYSLEVWHERLGKLVKRVNVSPAVDIEVNFNFTG